MAQEPKKVGHAIDGIEEYDNPLPRWWVWLFYGSVAFAIGYCVLMPSWPGYEGLSGWSQFRSYARELAAAPRPAAPAAEAIEHAIGDKSAVEAGKAVFTARCAACHGPEAKGLIGPNLLDDKWVRGQGKPADIFDIVNNGTAKGMPAWKGQLPAADMVEVVAFVHGLSHPTDPFHPPLP